MLLIVGMPMWVLTFGLNQLRGHEPALLILDRVRVTVLVQEKVTHGTSSCFLCRAYEGDLRLGVKPRPYWTIQIFYHFSFTIDCQLTLFGGVTVS